MSDCPFYKSLAQEKRDQDIKFLKANKVCPVRESGDTMSIVSKYVTQSAPRKMKGSYLGFTIHEHEVQGQKYYYGHSFKYELIDKLQKASVLFVSAPIVGVGLIKAMELQRGLPFPFSSDSADIITTATSGIIFTGSMIVALSMAGIVELIREKSVSVRNAEQITTKHYTSITALMDSIYKIVQK